MQIGSNSYGGFYQDKSMLLPNAAQSSQETAQPSAQQSRVVGGQNRVFANQTDINLKIPSAALASALGQMMVRRSDLSTERLIV